MIALAISVCYLLIAIVVLCSIVYLVLYGINEFVYAIPPRVTQGVWFIVLCLVIIAFLTLLSGQHVSLLR